MYSQHLRFPVEKDSLRFLALVLATFLIGALIGTGVAFAHTTVEDMESGTHLSGPYTHTTYQDPAQFPDFNYDADHVVNANDDFPDATEFTLHDTRYFNGTAPSDVVFGFLLFYDMKAESWELNPDFECLPVDGVDETLLTPWTYDGFGENNLWFVAQQWIWKATGTTQNCVFSITKPHFDAWNASDS